MRSIVSGLTAAALCVALGSAAKAHDVWANGLTVPSWVKATCCGPEDVHHLTPDQVHQVDGGYKVDGYPDLIPLNRALPSQDGDYWIFYRVTDTSNGPNYSPVYCFFIPMGA